MQASAESLTVKACRRCLTTASSAACPINCQTQAWVPAALMRSGCRPGAGLMRRLSALLLLCVVALGHAGGLSPLESQKIDYLITSVATLGDAKFIRNGRAYDARTA